VKEARLAVVNATLLKKSNVAYGDDAAIFHLVDPYHRLRQWSDYGGQEQSFLAFVHQVGSKSKARSGFTMIEVACGSIG
jgi:hypothetical protein